MDERQERSGSEEELQEEIRRLKEENEQLRELSAKERLYEKIHVSVRTMDMIIAGLCILFVIVVILGMMKG
ncbi:hypothetical protein [Lacrimispora sp. 210928-DFI.3.58]|uniref:hypothetical protein n=1 Tax=Lacrimispora sp. 210928-DFI.3.58 TaxID=2883214 RepID=UPI001D092B30|nr:hypothetical protein [Lacrimispora sp. 210928-DFI.3.58]MCB7319840.1 hypothetical protein [Lacrimispora sp. 210928-DFI.3.58]